ncbi:MAG: flagellar biosynthesis protein FlhB [Spirochaetota bacterium]|nr:flagellar biosynthesis protein FlhB [Spirochaetota bacterium]
MKTKEELRQLIFAENPMSCDMPKGHFIDLQLFAKPEDEGRTEEPTAYKQRKAREEGKVARSQELVSALVLLFSFITLWILGDYTFGQMKEVFKKMIINMDIPFTNGNLGYYLYNAIWDIFVITGPILLVTVVIAFLSNVIQVGFQFAPKAMKVDWKKVSFTANKMFSKIFFSKQTAMNLAKSVFKVAVVVAVAYSFVSWQKQTIINTINMDVAESFSTLTKISFYIAGTCCLIFLVLSVPDLYFQKAEHKESLKMSRHEVKEERKDTEGDPFVKQRLRERQRELMSRRMMDEVPQADVVITNPTHYAIAVKYDSDNMMAPLVVAKGQDYIALRIKEIAIENEVHIVENKALAQSLYPIVEVGDEIPEDFYQAIAEILAFVIRAREAVRG